MCGRYTLAAHGQVEFGSRFGLDERLQLAPRFNICPGDEVLAITEHAEHRLASRMHWGLIPQWSESRAVGYRMINARSETAAHKPAFAQSLRERRCLVPADGFYEWQRNAEGGRKLPWHVTLPGAPVFAFAGIWTTWMDPASFESVASCTILTRSAEAALMAIHDRQPVILGGPDAESLWLDEETPAEVIGDLMRSSAPAPLTARRVSFVVNDARHDAADCLDDPGPEPQGTLFSP